MVRPAFVAPALVLVVGCVGTHQARPVQLAQTPVAVAPARNYATFWSHSIGTLAVESIYGNSLAWWAKVPTRMTIVFANSTGSAVLLSLAEKRALISRVTIDDPADGEYYALAKVRIIGYKTESFGYPPALHPALILAPAVFHLKCGPPTCLSNIQR